MLTQRTRGALRVLTLIAAVFLGGCDDLFCDDSRETRQASVNVFDLATNRVFATFYFEQEGNTPGGCGDLEAETSLTIRNASDSAVSFAYQIDYRLNSGGWTYQGSVVDLAPGAEVDVGVVTSSVVRIDLGRFTIVTDAPRYR